MSTHNDILFSGPIVTIGSFDCPVTAPDFRNTGPAPDYLLAFPRTVVRIRHVGMKTSIVADPNIVTLYNQGQEYERDSVADRGDHCDWLAFAPSAVAEALADAGVNHRGDPVRLFSVAYGMSPPTAYATVHRLVARLGHGPQLEAMAIEDTALQILELVLKAAQQQPPTGKRRATAARHALLVHRVRELLAAQYDQSVSLASVAGEVGTTPYHLSRVFRHKTGATIFQYLTQLRLRNAMQRLRQDSDDLAAIGVAMGFSDHSHFSKQFRNTFNTSPSRFRALLQSPTAPLHTP
ncbi:MAG: AraC family transcriptional regulator [Pseudomonadota bacterium]